MVTTDMGRAVDKAEVSGMEMALIGAGLAAARTRIMTDATGRSRARFLAGTMGARATCALTWGEILDAILLVDGRVQVSVWRPGVAAPVSTTGIRCGFSLAGDPVTVTERAAAWSLTVPSARVDDLVVTIARRVPALSIAGGLMPLQ